MVSYWQWVFDGSVPLTLKPWVARATTAPKAARHSWLWQPTGKELVIPISTALPHLQPQSCREIRCLPGLVTWPSLEGGQVKRPKTKVHLQSEHLPTAPNLWPDTIYAQVGWDKNALKDCYECCLPSHHSPHHNSVDLNQDPFSGDFVSPCPKQVLISVCLAVLITVIPKGSTIPLPYLSSPGTFNHSCLIKATCN